MKLRSLLSLAVAAAIMLTTLLCGIPAAAKGTALGVSGEYSNGTYILRVYGLTKKQYSAFVNQKDGFRLNVTAADGKSSVFISSDLNKKSDVPAMDGYNGGYKVYGGLVGNGVAAYSTWAGHTVVSGEYGTAPGKSCGFRWELDAGDREVMEFLPSLTKSPQVSVSFATVYRDSSAPAGLSASNPVTAAWGDAPISAERCANGVEVSIPTENYYKYSSTDFAKLTLRLKFGNYAITTEFSGGDGFTTTASVSGKDCVGSVAVKGKFTPHGGITLTYTLSDKAGRKALASKKITAQYYVTSGRKIISGGKKSFQLLPGGKTQLRSLSIEDIPVQEYTGKPIEPQPVLRYGYVKLRKGIDYTLSYKSNTRIGTGKVVLKGKGAYKGTVTLEFSIVPRAEKLSFRYNDDGLILSWWNVPGAEKYELQQLSGGEYVPFMTFTSELSLTLPADTAGSYRVRAVGSAGGIDVPGEWSPEITVE